MKVVFVEYVSGPLVAMSRIDLAKSQTRGVLKQHTPTQRRELPSQ